MKILYLVRHAKSSWEYESLSDFDRPLNKRGKKDALFMGGLISMRKIKPELIISSPAKRAAKTSEIFSKQIGWDKSKTQFEETLYDASKSEILSVIHKQANGINSIMMFAHNPGLTDIANFLTGENIDNIPTSGITAIKFNKETWQELDGEDGELEFLEYPKKYK